MSDLLQNILFPKEFEYELSEKLFIDLWEKWGKPDEIVEMKDINSFLTELVEKSKGSVIVDHFSRSNYDHVHKIVFEQPYTKIYWKDFNKLRLKNMEQKLDEIEIMSWGVFGYATYLYTLLHIRKIKFIIKNNHLFVLLLSHLIPSRKVKKYLITKNNELISEEIHQDEFYTEYTFFEGNKENMVKHNCFVNNLPYYTCLIQPKEGNTNTSFSKTIMLIETINEINQRMGKVKANLINSDEYDYDQLFAQGNIIRRVLEYVLKFYCLIKELDIKIEEKYGNIMLGDLKKEINGAGVKIKITTKMIRIANELSHDSGQVFGKEEIISFWEDVNELFKQIYRDILN